MTDPNFKETEKRTLESQEIERKVKSMLTRAKP